MFLPIPDRGSRPARGGDRARRDGGRHAPVSGRWLRAKEAAEYLALTRSALYSRVHSQAIPHYKVEGILIFKRDELDRWTEEHRVEALDAYRYPVERRHRATTALTARTTRGSTPQLTEKKQRPAPKKRERPLPPPLGGTDEQKDGWAHDLEITRAELDEMSPPEFDKAWKARNERLEAAGVFDQLTELEEAYGERLWSMTSSELIDAIGKLRESASLNPPVGQSGIVSNPALAPS